ncbi:MAG: hypothetical protein AAGC79_09210 [Pseudomonadota bacterium]
MTDQTPKRWFEGNWVQSSSGSENDNRTDVFAPLAIDTSLIRAACETGDLETAIQLATAHVDAEFAMTYGDLVTELETEAALAQSFLSFDTEALAEINSDLARQPPMIPAPMTNGGTRGPGDPNTEVPPKHWQLRDKIGVAGAGLGIAGLSVASYVVFQTTFEASALPIIDDNPHLAGALAVIAPAGGYAVKLIGNVFTDPANRDQYRKGLAIGGGVALVAYIPMFGALFEGLSGVFDAFAEPNHLLGWGFNVSHVVCEILISASLWGYADAVMRKYAPSEEVENPGIAPRARTKDARTADIEISSARHGRASGQLTRLYGIRDSARTLVETAIRQKMNEQPRDGLL